MVQYLFPLPGVYLYVFSLTKLTSLNRLGNSMLFDFLAYLFSPLLMRHSRNRNQKNVAKLRLLHMFLHNIVPLAHVHKFRNTLIRSGHLEPNVGDV